MSDRKIGLLRSWHADRFFGVLVVGPEAALERYFLHGTQLRTKNVTPKAGAKIAFEVSAGPLKRPSDMPQAIKADIIANDGAAE